MKKMQILAVALFSMCAFGMYATISASAGELLLNGAAITKETTLEVAGEMLFEDMGLPGTPADILCSGIGIATTSNGILGFGTTVLTLAKELLEETEKKEGPYLECIDDKGFCSGVVLITSLNLPWHIEIELMGAGVNQFLMLTLAEEGKIPTYLVDCNTIVGLVLDECEGASSGRLENTAGGLLLEIGEVAETAPGSCSLGGVNKELLEGTGIITTPSGGTLTVS